jgi:hypothetical protein
MFQNFLVEIIASAVGNGYQNMYTVIFETENITVVCKAYTIQ